MKYTWDNRYVYRDSKYESPENNVKAMPLSTTCSKLHCTEMKELQKMTLRHKRIKHFLSGLASYRGAGKYLARPGRKQATATEDFEFHISYL